MDREVTGNTQYAVRSTQYASALEIAFDARMLHYRRAGIGHYSISLLRALSQLSGEEGLRVQVLQMRSDAEPAVRDPRFRRVPMLTPPHHRFEQPVLGAELLRLRPRPALIHSPDFVPPLYRRMPAVANIQDLAFLLFPGMTLLTDESKRYYGQVYRAAESSEALIALSNSARDDIVSLLGVKPEKVAVIPAAAGPQFKPPADLPEAQRQAAREFGLPTPQEGGYVLFVGTVEPRKNLPALLEAYRMLLDAGRAKPAPVLAVAGQEGWLSERAHARIDELGLRRHVQLLGGVSDASLVRLYQGARAFAMPSIYEGFGLPVLEAMQSGVPVVSSNAGSLAEVAGDAALLVAPGDVEGWAAALECVLLDEAEANRLREAGLEQAGRFSWERAARETLGLYRKVIEG